MKGVTNRIPDALKGAGVGLGVVLAGALAAGAIAPQLKSLLMHPMTWVLGGSTGAVAVSWVKWDDNSETSGSNTIATTSGVSRSGGSGAINASVHPSYATITQKVTQHTTSFPPGSQDFAEALRDGTRLLDHASNVYQPQAQTQEWQTITAAPGFIGDTHEISHSRGSSPQALPPSTQPPITAHHTVNLPASEPTPDESNESTTYWDKWEAVAQSEPEPEEGLASVGSDGDRDGADLWDS